MRVPRKPIMWPAWRYGPHGEAEIFQNPNDVPLGWQDAPMDASRPEQSSKVLDRDELIKRLTDRGVEVSPLWPNAHMEKLLET